MVYSPSLIPHRPRCCIQEDLVSDIMERVWIKPSHDQISTWVEDTFPYKIRRSPKLGKIYLIDSPFVPGDRGWHVGISVRSGWVRDFRPQYSDIHNKSFLSFVAEVEGVSFAKAVKLICGDGANIKAMMRDAKKRLLKNKESDDAPLPPSVGIPSGLLKLEDEGAKVDDANTASKVNVFQADSLEGSDRAFSKPDKVDWGTYVMPVPEFSAGDLGINYIDYIDGRARQKFMNLLGASMNLTVRVDGDFAVQNS